MSRNLTTLIVDRTGRELVLVGDWIVDLKLGWELELLIEAAKRVVLPLSVEIADEVGLNCAREDPSLLNLLKSLIDVVQLSLQVDNSISQPSLRNGGRI